MNFRILVINPGATSTKIAVFENESPRFKKTIEHDSAELDRYENVFEQYNYRLELIINSLVDANITLSSLSAVVGRGGLLRPMAGGTYSVNARMVDDMRKAVMGEHASNLGSVIADDLSRRLGIPAYIVDPVSTDEMDDVARITGFAEIDRVSLSHALNMKAVARKAAKLLGKCYEEMNLIMVHLGTGVSVSPHKMGRMVDVNNSREEGPFSPDRCGGVPAYSLVNLCFSGKYSHKEIKDKLMGKGGLYSYFGTRDVREVEKLADSGDARAGVVLNAMAYQVAKEIGAMATVLSGKVEVIVLTGGIAYSERVTSYIKQHVEYIAPVMIIPGEEEMESLALGCLRVLCGEETARIYE